MSYNFNLLVIGAGSAGLSAAKQAAKLGAKVAIVEQQYVGGTCVNRGCISKKLMVYASDFADLFEDAEGYGWTVNKVIFHWQKFVAVRDREIERLRSIQLESLDQLNIHLIRGQATFLNSNEVKVDDTLITAEKILIAVGGKPAKLDIPGIEHAITSKEIFNLAEVPKQLAVIGGGYIGVEFASIFRKLGTDVSLIDAEANILKGFDDDLRDAVRNGLAEAGIRFFFNTTVKEIQSESDKKYLTLTGDHYDTIAADTILYAVGRKPNLTELNIEGAGVELEKGAIAVDEFSRTNQPNIFAVGDCTNRLPLTPVAKAEGHAFACTEFGKQPTKIDYRYVPTAVFARPEAASIGLTEADARKQYGDEAVECNFSQFQPLFNSLSHSNHQALLKIVIKRDSGQILGVHVVAKNAAEMIQGIAIAVKHGFTQNELKDMIGIHPTTAEELFS